VEQIRSQLDLAYAGLSAASDLDEETATAKGQLMAMRDELTAAVQTFAARGVDSELTRIHGDLHLGQVLVANGEVFIIDFEGEPAKPVAQRRCKTNRLRDVAGMLRSFDYAAAVVRQKSLASHAHLPDARIRAFLEGFVRQATDAFLAGYRAAVPPVDPALERALLDLFLIEKAAYEIAYEAGNRPTWIDVPLRGLARIAERVLDRVAVT
jgi:maltose alpha-D-glucosyltransferase/alpha-amylase